MPAVTVNLAVEVDANSELIVFGQAAPTVTNPIAADVKLPASNLNNLIEFWEPSNAVGTRKSHLVIDSYKTTAFNLYGSLKSVLAGAFDCSAAEPYKTDASTAYISNYVALGGFGKVALGQVAHAVFGHVAATAAITNDSEFAIAMLAEDASTDWDTIKGAVQSKAKANLANALVKALVMKGFSGDAEVKESIDAPLLTAIVNQVIGQDPSRAKDQDNNQIDPDLHQKLVFAAGDTVYMSIKVLFPDVYLSTNSAKTTTDAPSGLGASGSKTFDLKITLS